MLYTASPLYTRTALLPKSKPHGGIHNTGDSFTLAQAEGQKVTG